MANRRAIVAQAVKAHPARSTGGTSAPRSAASGPNAALGQNKAVTPHPFTLTGPQKQHAREGQSHKAIAGPAAPTPPTSAPTPWSSAFELSKANANRKYLGTSHNLDLSEQAIKQDYGIDPQFNDYKSNPYSRAALLEQNYLEHNRGTMNTAGNQLYSGSTGNRLAANRQAEGLEYNQLSKTYRDALQGISDRRLSATNEKGEEDSEAAWKNVEAAEKEPLDPTQAPVPRKRRKHRKKKN